MCWSPTRIDKKRPHEARYGAPIVGERPRCGIWPESGRFCQSKGRGSATLDQKMLILSPTSPDASQVQLEICSSERFVVRGPNRPIVVITTSIEAAMKAKTPGAPNRPRKNWITKELKITESRLHE